MNRSAFVDRWLTFIAPLSPAEAEIARGTFVGWMLATIERDGWVDRIHIDRAYAAVETRLAEFRLNQ